MADLEKKSGKPAIVWTDRMNHMFFASVQRHKAYKKTLKISFDTKYIEVIKELWNMQDSPFAKFVRPDWTTLQAKFKRACDKVRAAVDDKMNLSSLDGEMNESDELLYAMVKDAKECQDERSEEEQEKEKRFQVMLFHEAEQKAGTSCRFSNPEAVGKKKKRATAQEAIPDEDAEPAVAGGGEARPAAGGGGGEAKPVAGGGREARQVVAGGGEVKPAKGDGTTPEITPKKSRAAFDNALVESLKDDPIIVSAKVKDMESERKMREEKHAQDLKLEQRRMDLEERRFAAQEESAKALRIQQDFMLSILQRQMTDAKKQDT